MVPDIQQIIATSAFVTSPRILAAAFRALTSFLLHAFINICVSKEREDTRTEVKQANCN